LAPAAVNLGRWVDRSRIATRGSLPAVYDKYADIAVTEDEKRRWPTRVMDGTWVAGGTN